jgi:MFS family permease
MKPDVLTAAPRVTTHVPPSSTVAAPRASDAASLDTKQDAALPRNVIALTSGLLLWTASHFGVIAVLPLFLHDQGHDAAGIGFALGVAGIAQLCVRPFGGWIVDAFGRKAPLVSSLLVLAAGAALLLVPGGWAVVANRILAGAAFSLGTTAFYTLVVESAPAGRAGEVQGYVALGITLGVGIGPPLGVALYQRAVGEPVERLAPFAIAAAVAALASAGCFLATVSAFRPLGRTHRYSLSTNFRREGLLPAFLNCCAQIPNTAFSAFLPLWAMGRGVGNPGMLFVGSQIGAVGSRLFGGRLADRYGQRAVLVPAMVGVTAVLAGMSVVAGLPWFFALAVAFGALFGVSFVILPSLAGRAAPSHGRGAAMNTFGLGADAAQLLGPWGLGLAATAWGLGGALTAAAAVSLIGAVAYAAMVRRAA